MNFLNKSSKNKFYSKKPNYNTFKKFIIKKSSSCIDHRDNIKDKIQKTNKNSNILSSIDPKGKTLSNFSKINYASFSSSPKILGKTTSLPLLSYSKSKKIELDERFKNFQKMRKYRIKLIKKKKVDTNEDQLFKFLHENGLHYSFSQNKYIIGDKFEYYSKYLPEKFKVNFNSENIQKTKNSNNSKNQTHSNVPSESSKKKSKNKKNKKKGLFYSTTEEDDDDKLSFKKYM